LVHVDYVNNVDGLATILGCRVSSLPMKYLGVNMPTYFMSLFLLMASIVNYKEKLQRGFLWGGNGEDFKLQLVSWSKVCSPIFVGVGVQKLSSFQPCHLGEMVVVPCDEREVLWKVVMDLKYGNS
jgi:hypothetical protein